MNNTEELKKLIEKSNVVLQSLKQSVEEALDKKQKLGQYAVIAKNGKIIKLFSKSEFGS
ncbi:MAG: hypothetical protein L3J53_06410 [Proteobacteria bacterium]|nr:hypothetical protein [Pseudomonadota bacterium]